jgi:thioredoxin reductase
MQVLLAIGRRGTPRKLNVPGEVSEKVAYRLLEPERIIGKKILIVGGGDSAVESALLLMGNNKVSLSYRKDKFARIKTQNKDSLQDAIDAGSIQLLLNTEVTEISPETIMLQNNISQETIHLDNDLIYIFAGGELPTQFLKSVGITIDKKFGKIVKSYRKQGQG